MASGPDVRCTAYYLEPGGGTRDVTAEATWLHSPAALGEFVRPGYFVPRTDGVVALWARYEGLEATLRTSFLVNAAAPARYLYWLSGSVTADSGEVLPGAVVTVLDGYAAGTSAVTNANGYYLIEPVLTGETFTIQASKEGYAASSVSYRVDPPVGPSGNPPFLGFRLRKLE